jgi:hypothetical protein
VTYVYTQGRAQRWRPVHERTAHTCPAAQFASLVQAAAVLIDPAQKQAPVPPTRSTHLHVVLPGQKAAALKLHVHALHAGDAATANAGTRKLVSTGAVQTIAAPAPIRLSIRRRDMPSRRSISSIISLPERTSPDATMQSTTPERIMLRP